MITEEVARKQLRTVHREGSALAEEFEAEQARLLKLYGKRKPRPKGALVVVIRKFSKDGEETKPAEQETQDTWAADEIRFEERYQSWYSRALPLMKQLAPDRYAEFQSFYVVDPRYPWGDRTAYVIQDYFRGRESDGDIAALTARCFRNQLAIVKSVSDRLAWSKLDTNEQVERGLQLSFLDTARKLKDIDVRSGGVLAGAVLEGWLRKLCTKHKLKFRKQAPPLREYIDALHTAKVFDIPVHAQGVWLAEIAGRSKAEGEVPTKLQVRDLSDGSRWLITNIF